jgi:hypothetical protein
MPSSDKKQARVWNRWITYLGTANRADDPYLESLDSSKTLQRLKPIIVSGFAQALRTGQLQSRGRQSVVAATVKGDIGSLVQAFRSSRRKDPTRDPDGRLSTLLSWQYAGFASFDPPARREKAISLRVLKFMRSNAASALQQHTADLAIGAFFFACRSCEYLKVQGARRTKTIRQGDIEFRRGRTILPFTSPNLHLAETVSILFRDQKNRVKGIFRTAWATSDPDACPVASFAQVIRRVSSLPGSTADTLIYNYKAASNRSFLAVSDAVMITTLRVAVNLIGKDELGYQASDVGTHSIRSGAAMALVLSQHAAWRIMLAGRWQSQAFLIYIREQIQQFSKGVSERMISNPDFYHVPDIDTLDPRDKNEAEHAVPLDAGIVDGRASNHTDMLQISFVG